MVEEASTPFCRFCRIVRNERCSCADHELCRDCPMPRTIMIAVRHLEERVSDKTGPYYVADCPFCGCDQMYTEYNPLYHMPWVVECCKCHAQGPHADTEKEAFNLWNERVME